MTVEQKNAILRNIERFMESSKITDLTIIFKRGNEYGCICTRIAGQGDDYIYKVAADIDETFKAATGYDRIRTIIPDDPCKN